MANLTGNTGAWENMGAPIVVEVFWSRLTVTRKGSQI